MKEQEFLATLGRRIRIQRVKRGMQQRELATITGIHRNTLGRFEGGADIPIMALVRICVALEIPAGKMLDDVLNGG